ncbi:M23 family metallopeptidase [Staphylococcus ureilyticus]|uniref:M23 family metallopeptidase n=1 Tax=Staphylococcus ureilyticus TaxID=94138 RepID=UPI00387AF2DF
MYNQFSDYFQEISSYHELERLLKSYNTIRHKNKLYKHIQLNYKEEYIWLDVKKTSSISVTLNKYHEIIGFVLIPMNLSNRHKETNLRYTIPVLDTGFVYAGGENELVNHHYSYKNQRYALDLILVKNHLTYHGNPNCCESYYNYNQSVIAPSNGVVIDIVDGIADALPGENNMKHPEGNYIIIKHTDKEFSMIAHLKPNSFEISVGEQIRRGQLIARVGNSGNTMEPHVHFQIMNQNNPQFAKTYKCKLLDNVLPEKGDMVSYSGDSIILENQFDLARRCKQLSSNIRHIFKI